MAYFNNQINVIQLDLDGNVIKDFVVKLNPVFTISQFSIHRSIVTFNDNWLFINPNSFDHFILNIESEEIIHCEREFLGTKSFSFVFGEFKRAYFLRYSDVQETVSLYEWNFANKTTTLIDTLFQDVKSDNYFYQYTIGDIYYADRYDTLTNIVIAENYFDINFGVTFNILHHFHYNSRKKGFLSSEKIAFTNSPNKNLRPIVLIENKKDLYDLNTTQSYFTYINTGPKLVCYDLALQKSVWETSFNSKILNNLIFFENSILVSLLEDGWIHMINKKTGETMWSVRSGFYYQGNYSIYDNMVIVSSGKNYWTDSQIEFSMSIEFFDERTGSSIYKTRHPFRTINFNKDPKVWMMSSTDIKDDILFTGDGMQLMALKIKVDFEFPK